MELIKAVLCDSCSKKSVCKYHNNLALLSKEINAISKYKYAIDKFEIFNVKLECSEWVSNQKHEPFNATRTSRTSY